MPMLPFLPWATISEPMIVGAFNVVPLRDVLRAHHADADVVAAVHAVVAAYGFTRPVDVATIPVLHQGDVPALADLTEPQIRAYFAFRERLAFACLAQRQFFNLRYLNSDNLRLVIQGFVPGSRGGTVVASRRRDGGTNNMLSREVWKERRPHHVSGWCELPRDVDVGLLGALEALESSDLAPTDADLAARVDDVVRLFVGANTDSADVSPHAELVDLVSAFGRLVDEWKEGPTVRAFEALLPAPTPPYPTRVRRPRAEHPDLAARIARESVRSVWLRNAILLRHNYGHGKVTAPQYAPLWGEREHLLLGAVALPLALKALLAQHGRYEFSPGDVALNHAFDDLALVDAFAGPARSAPASGDVPAAGTDAGDSPEARPEAPEAIDDDGRGEDDGATRWREVIGHALTWPALEQYARALEAWMMGRAADITDEVKSGAEGQEAPCASADDSDAPE